MRVMIAAGARLADRKFLDALSRANCESIACDGLGGLSVYPVTGGLKARQDI